MPSEDRCRCLDYVGIGKHRLLLTTPRDRQLMSKHRVLSLKPLLRLEWRGQDDQNETVQPGHSNRMGDSITLSTQTRFSVHTRVFFPIFGGLVVPALLTRPSMEPICAVTPRLDDAHPGLPAPVRAAKRLPLLDPRANDRTKARIAILDRYDVMSIACKVVEMRMRLLHQQA